jgi:hypothetical protein
MARQITAPRKKQPRAMVSAVDALVYLALSDAWSGMLINERRIAGIRWE